MILPDLILPGRANKNLQYTGLDSLEKCNNKQHFKNYPYRVNYNYNSRGFRDAEWPDNLENVVWCIGDSFTVGLGCPLDHVWPRILQQKLNQRTINVSMDGASNEWIARRTCDIIDAIHPSTIIIQWSYTHRREDTVENGLNKLWTKFYNNVKDSSWPECKYSNFNTLPEFIKVEVHELHQWNYHKQFLDENRALHYTLTSLDNNNINLLNCIKQVESTGANIIHSFIPEFAQDWNNSDLSGYTFIPEIKKLDLARDYHHYDTLTATNFVHQLLMLLD